MVFFLLIGIPYLLILQNISSGERLHIILLGELIRFFLSVIMVQILLVRV